MTLIQSFERTSRLVQCFPKINIKSLSTATDSKSNHVSELSSNSGKLQPHELELLKPMLRVNQAGEIGANYIYMGQHLVFRGDRKLGPLIEHMWDQEKVHLEKFDQLIEKYQVRPTALTPLCKAAGLALGISTALMGKEAAMACTEAVETVIGQHYNEKFKNSISQAETNDFSAQFFKCQLRDLAEVKDQDISELRKTIRQFRDDELEHLETAVAHDSHKAPFYSGLSQVIQSGCKAAIWLVTRV